MDLSLRERKQKCGKSNFAILTVVQSFFQTGTPDKLNEGIAIQFIWGLSVRVSLLFLGADNHQANANDKPDD